MAIPKRLTGEMLKGMKARVVRTFRNGAGSVAHAGATVTIKSVVRGKGLTVQTAECPMCHQSGYFARVSREDLDLIVEAAPVVLDEAELEQTGAEVPADKFLYGMEREQETGWVKIYPMNDEGKITIHGVEEARAFIDHLLDCFR